MHSLTACWLVCTCHQPLLRVVLEPANALAQTCALTCGCDARLCKCKVEEEARGDNHEDQGRKAPAVALEKLPRVLHGLNGLSNYVVVIAAVFTGSKQNTCEGQRRTQSESRASSLPPRREQVGSHAAADTQGKLYQDTEQLRAHFHMSCGVIVQDFAVQQHAPTHMIEKRMAAPLKKGWIGSWFFLCAGHRLTYFASEKPLRQEM